MPLVEVPIPNLLGGVSQQPPANRQPGQVEACDNAILHVVNGLSKRKGTRHLARLFAGLESVRLVHFINRDAEERYAVLLGERRVRVFSALDGTEFPVKVNGTATDAGRGMAGSGTPLLYLDPRRAGGVVDQDEDFVIGAGDWLSAVANSVTSYLTGRGPLYFGRRQSTSAVTADTVAEVGNGAAASISDIHQAYGVFASRQVFSMFVKKSSSAINDIEMVFTEPTLTNYAGARFDIDSAGVVTVGATLQTGSNAPAATVEAFPEGWYRCSVSISTADFPPPLSLVQAGTRHIRVRFHTNAATPANKRALLFGARVHEETRTAPSYILEQADLFKAVTVADSTFLLNTEQVTSMDTTQGTVVNPPRGFVFVRQGGLQDVNYTVVVKYLLASVLTTQTFTFTTGVVVTGLQTDDDVAEGLRALIDAHADLVATRAGSVIRIVTAASGGADRIHAIEARDSRGDTTMVALTLTNIGAGGFFNLAVNKFTDLPLFMDDDVVVGITGEPERAADDYYVRFVGDESANLVHGHWEESTRAGLGLDAGILTTFLASSMPQQLTRRQDDAAGTITGVPNAIYFDVSPVAWDTRLVGDEVSNPEPSFIGSAIRELFLYRGRLGFLADDAVILSEAGEVFNFWRTTVLDLPDTDPIDITSGVRDVVLFRNAVVTADACLLFSDRHQFSLLGDPVLTPATAQLAPVRSFENLTQAHPVDTGRGAIFARHDGTFGNLMEASLLRDDVTFRFEELFVQAPRYIVGAIRSLAHSSLTGLTLALAEGAGTLYAHQTFVDDQENRLQSAVHRWTFAADTLVRGLGFFEAELVTVVERAEGWFLESMLTDSELTEGGRPITHLDRRIDQSQAPSITYDGGSDTTTINLPYDIDAGGTIQVVDAASGLRVPITGSGVDFVEVHGDLSASDLYVGEAYDMAVTLTEPVIQAPSPRGGLIPRTGRPLDVRHLYLYVADTAFLRVTVGVDLRDSSNEEFSAAGLGTGLLLEGELTLFTGDADFAILGQSTEIAVTIHNDTPFPSLIQSGRWEALNRQRSAFA